VTVVSPLRVLHAGYPKKPDDYLGQVDSIFGKLLQLHLGSERLPVAKLDKIRRELAYGLGYTDGFGGRRRGLILDPDPDLLGKKYRVEYLRTVQTGTRIQGGRDSYRYYYGYDDAFGPYFSLDRSWRLAGLCSVTVFMDALEIPVDFLQKEFTLYDE
jgi:hypothetical protein